MSTLDDFAFIRKYLQSHPKFYILVPRAAQALKRVLDPNASELWQLWKEGDESDVDFKAWETDVYASLARLETSEQRATLR